VYQAPPQPTDSIDAMSSSRKKLPTFWANGPPPSFRWASWPAREHGLAAVMLVIGLVAVGFLVYRTTGHVHLAGMAVVALSVALWRFFLPVRYELNDDGVQQSVFGRHRGVPWDRVHRYEICRAGVLLLPFSDYCQMDVLRGLYLPWTRHRDDILNRVRYYLDHESDG
jgi:hypothetical protein